MAVYMGYEDPVNCSELQTFIRLSDIAQMHMVKKKEKWPMSLNLLEVLLPVMKKSSLFFRYFLFSWL